LAYAHLVGMGIYLVIGSVGVSFKLARPCDRLHPMSAGLMAHDGYQPL
jgi:hypothetical protein